MIWVGILIWQDGCDTSLYCPDQKHPIIAGTPGMILNGLIAIIQFYLIKKAPTSWKRTLLLVPPMGFMTYVFWQVSTELGIYFISDWIDSDLIQFSAFGIRYFTGDFMVNSIGMFISLALVQAIMLLLTTPKQVTPSDFQ